MLLFFLVLALHLLKLVPPLFGHSQHPVAVLTLGLREDRVDFSNLHFGHSSALGLHFLPPVVVDVELIGSGVPDSLEKLTILLNSLLVLFKSGFPLFPLLNLDIFVLFNSLLYNPHLVLFEFLEILLNNFVPFFIRGDQLLGGVDMVNCYSFLILLVVCADTHLRVIGPRGSH